MCVLFGLYVSQLPTTTRPTAPSQESSSPAVAVDHQPGLAVRSRTERGRQLQAGIPAEDELQLPARDTRVIKKNDAKDARDAEQGEHLRRTGGGATNGRQS
jgi:hypothetical protein